MKSIEQQRNEGTKASGRSRPARLWKKTMQRLGIKRGSPSSWLSPSGRRNSFGELMEHSQSVTQSRARMGHIRSRIICGKLAARVERSRELRVAVAACQFLPALFFCCLLFTGCAFVPCDNVFPRLQWYWSAEAKACRQERHARSAPMQNAEVGLQKEKTP